MKLPFYFLSGYIVHRGDNIYRHWKCILYPVFNVYQFELSKQIVHQQIQNLFYKLEFKVCMFVFIISENGIEVSHNLPS